MAQTASSVFAAVRSLVGDFNGDYATDAVQVPLLQVACDQLENELYANPNIGKFKSVVVIPGLASGATSMASYFNSGQPLELLDDIITMKEKPAGTADTNYTDMDRVDDLPTITPVQLNQYFAFRGSDIQLIGATQSLDVRIFGIFNPTNIVDGTSAVPPGTMPFLKYATASLTARAHGNSQMANDYATMAEQQLNAVLNKIIMEQQVIPTRQRAYGEDNCGIIGQP